MSGSAVRPPDREPTADPGLATEPAVPPAESRTDAKHRAIVEAATALFLGQGYLGTSMDEVAAAAGVSKQTVYKHFADKEGLFSEIVTSTVSQVSDPVHAAVLGAPDSGDVEADLCHLARSQLAHVMQPRVLALRRLVIGEANRFPALGRTFYELGPGRTMSALATRFERLAARGALRIDDPVLAAEQFNWLIMASPLNQAMLLGDDGWSADEVARQAETGVRLFLASYG